MLSGYWETVFRFQVEDQEPMMATASRNHERIEALRALMDLLCASDLTLAESKDLCGRLSGLLSEPGLERPSTTGLAVRARAEPRVVRQAVS